jgi:YD repeat-containing protein
MHDEDGNLTVDGRWTYTWDGENRLVEMKRDTSTPTVSSRLRLTFEYDHQGRRIRKQFYTYSGGWVEQRDTTCLYDGWTVMAELDANASNARLRTYVWGTDLSGSAQGAGGVGGLLWVNNYQTTFDGQTLPTGIHFVAYDGNGNVSALVKASDGSISARYEYGPFAESVRVTGALADAQPIRFSTKWTDIESGFLYYGIGTTIQSEHGEVDEHGQHWGGGRSEPRRVSCERAFGRC